MSTTSAAASQPQTTNAQGQAAPNQTAALLLRLLRSPKGAFGAAVVLLLVVMGVLGPFVAPYDPIELHLVDPLKSPSSQYWFGTDELGRDIFSRVVYGARVSLEAGLISVLVAALVGVVTGLFAGYLGSWYDSVIMRIWDTLLAFPAIFLAIGIVTILGPGRLNAILAVAVINMPAFARLVRAATLSVMARDFVLATQAIGASKARIMFRTIFPNCLSPLMVQIAIAAPTAIVVEATLSYLGLGSQPPDPSWGNMLQEAQAYLYQAPTYGIFPGIAITLVVMGMNFLADGLQDAIDPRRIRSSARMG